MLFTNLYFSPTSHYVMLLMIMTKLRTYWQCFL